jgi:hypothetical protein
MPEEQLDYIKHVSVKISYFSSFIGEQITNDAKRMSNMD